YILASQLGLPHQPTQQRVLIVRIKCAQRYRELPLAIFVSRLQLFSKASEKSCDGAVLGKRIKSPDQHYVALVHYLSKALLEDLDEAFAVAWAQPAEQWTVFTDLSR